MDVTNSIKYRKELFCDGEPLCKAVTNSIKYRKELFCDGGLQCSDATNSTKYRKELFCDGEAQCLDGSDENLCGPRTDPNRADDCDPEICRVRLIDLIFLLNLNILICILKLALD